MEKLNCEVTEKLHLKYSREMKKIKEEILINRRWDKIIVFLSVIGIVINILKGIIGV